MRRRRLSDALVERGLADSEAEAFALIADDRVTVDGAPANNPSRQIAPGEAILVVEPERFVSRGGEKLEGALEAFDISVEGLTVVDVGAATGGFSDCVLQRGAARVVAIDVGRGLLHPRIAADPRVVVMEGRSIRATAEAPELTEVGDLVVVDLSFISAASVSGLLARLVRPGGRLLVLVKPQFEASHEEASRGAGVIHDEEVRSRVVAEVRSALEAHGLRMVGSRDSVLAGRSGNREIFLLAERPEA